MKQKIHKKLISQYSLLLVEIISLYFQKINSTKKRNPLKTFFTLSTLFTLITFNTIAQKKDTLTDVIITTINTKSKVTYNTPTQEINTTQLIKTNTNSVADVVKQFAGVQVKDYGGVGGLKTVNVRSLGTNHTGVLYDGIAINDAQAGQIDLGKITTDNIHNIKLFSSSPTQILLPAKAFSYASVLAIVSTSSIVEKEKNLLKLNIQNASFQNYSGNILYKTKINTKLQTAIVAWGQQAKNQYPYTSYENTNTSEKRKNSDIKANKLEFDLDYFPNDFNKIKIKTQYYKSNRGLPGAIIFYNNTSSQRLLDETYFTQATFQKRIKTKHGFLFNTKYSNNFSRYTDPNYFVVTSVLINKFIQKEFFSSVAYKYNFKNNFQAAIAADYFRNTLKRTDPFVINFPNPSRNTFINNIAVNFKNTKAEITANLLHTSITEQVQFGNLAKPYSKLSPAIAVNYKPYSNHNFYIRAFYKNIFRAPTFNDLYYTNIGNTNLFPETAKQFNIGITHKNKIINLLDNITITVDFYTNKVCNKILAVPRQNLFQWSMQNIGNVNIKGVDATLQLIKTYKKIKVTANFAYTYQQALDVSDKLSTSYNTQLPYTPAHTATINITTDYKNIFLNYSFLGTSLRYKQGDAIPENELNPWSTHDVSAGIFIKQSHKIILATNNLFNKQYEIIKFYPMPKFNYSIAYTFTFKK